MPNQADKVLIVDDDPEVRTLLREQVLNSPRFEVLEAKDGPDGLQQVRAHNPDLIIVDLVMPGLSGTDFLVALKSQGYTGPIIVQTKRGNEGAAIDCFRLGATDYFTKPLREAEVLQVIERGLEEVRLRRERKELLERLQQTNKQLEARIRDLTTLNSVGKIVTSLYDLEQLFARVLEAAISIAEADHATLLLRDEDTNRLILRAGKNMTLVMQEKLGMAVKDEIADLVMISGEATMFSGDGLKHFRSSTDLLATIYAPLMIQGKAIGVLTVGNHRKRRAFDSNVTGLIDILAGYAAIAIVNARLFVVLERRAHTVEAAYEALKAREASQDRALAGLMSLRQPLEALKADIKRLVRDSGALPGKLAEPLGALGKKVNDLLESVDELSRREGHKS
jgi:DNA-binding response OmpR family regulator